MKIQPLKGFRDFLPVDALKRNWLKEKITSVFINWGYDPMETPTLEPLELFKGQIGEDEKLFFTFTDHGGREVALRYDQTVPTCRIVGQYNQQLPMPFKRFQIQSAFRAENTQKGRYREFLQCDADIFGVASPFADAEVIALSLDIFRTIGFSNVQVKINDRALLKDFPYEAIVAIDKLEKIGADGVIADMVKKGITEQQAKDYLQTVKNLQPNDTIKTILNYLHDYGFPQDWFVFDPTIARSFSYSTGAIWEIVIPEFSTGSVLGGERFDKLIEQVSGAPIPGTGFGLGFDRTLEAAEAAGIVPEFKTNTQILVTIFSPELQSKSLNITKLLRDENIPTELYPDPTAKLEKQLKYANRKGIPFVIIAGPDELARDVVQIKNMTTQERIEKGIEEVVSDLNYAAPMLIR